MNSDLSLTNNSETINIISYNLRKNREITHSILNDPTSAKYHILLLQEQYFSTYTKSSLMHQTWTLVQPKLQDGQRPHVAIYINNRKIPKNCYEILDSPNQDTAAIALKTQTSSDPLLIANIYNLRDSQNRFPHMAEMLTYIQQLGQRPNSGIMIAGDFNLHHPLWNAIECRTHDAAANTLLEKMSQINLRLLTPPGMITFPRSSTSLDLIWGDDGLKYQTLKCGIAKNNDHGSDHLPIEIMLNLKPHQFEAHTRGFNYKKTDWQTFEAKLVQFLPPLKPARTHDEIDTLAKEITNALQKSIEKTTP